LWKKPEHYWKSSWSEDKDGDNEPDGNEIEWPIMLDHKSAMKLDGKHPSFSVAVSCNVGQSQQPNNLASRLLLSGGAIGVIASTVSGPRSNFFWHDIDAKLDMTTFGDDNVAPLFFKGLLNGDFAGKVLSDAKKNSGTENGSESFTGKASFNYFGDPSLKLSDIVDDIVEQITPDNQDEDTTIDEKEKNSGCSCSLIFPA